MFLAPPISRISTNAFKLAILAPKNKKEKLPNLAKLKFELENRFKGLWLGPKNIQKICKNSTPVSKLNIWAQKEEEKAPKFRLYLPKLKFELETYVKAYNFAPRISTLSKNSKLYQN